MRLGETMVEKGLIDKATLGKARDRQVIFGGRIGTNLVEMGAISEETLVKFLGKVLGVPCAGPEQFKDVPQDVLDSVPAATAGKYFAFPIGKERSRLHVAMRDPNDIRAVDELRFIVGLDVRPYVASELRILYELEKYFGIKRDLRFINILDEEKAEAAAMPVTHGLPREHAHEVVESDKPAAPRSAHFAPPTAQSSPAGHYEMLASPLDTEQIAEVVVSAASVHLLRAILFKVNGREVACWKAKGPGMKKDVLPGLRITLDTPSIFKDVVEDRRAYKGPVLPVAQNLNLLDALGGGAPLEAVACPLVINGRVRGVLYGDNGEGSMIGHGRLQDVGGIMAKAAMSFQVLLLKQKILAPS